MPVRSLLVLSLPAPPRPSSMSPSFHRPLLSPPAKADISCAISTGHIMCYRQLECFLIDRSKQVFHPSVHPAGKSRQPCSQSTESSLSLLFLSLPRSPGRFCAQPYSPPPTALTTP